MNNNFGKVGVLMGGWSMEREISLQSGELVLQSLQRSNINAIGLDISRESVIQLGEHQIDCAFVILHGQGGEDGIVQAMLEVLDIPFTGSGVLASALAMHKGMAKTVWRSNGISTPSFAVVNDYESLIKEIKDIGYPLAIKPVAEGSSIGVSCVESEDTLQKAYQMASQNNCAVIVEDWITGEEYAVGFINNQELPPIRLEVSRQFYDYVAKYEDDQTQYHCPCGLSDSDIQSLQSICVTARNALGVEGWGRADVIRDDDGQFHILELNTIPGMTNHSLIPIAAAAIGMDFDALVLNILSTVRRQGR